MLSLTIVVSQTEISAKWKQLPEEEKTRYRAYVKDWRQEGAGKRKNWTDLTIPELISRLVKERKTKKEDKEEKQNKQEIKAKREDKQEPKNVDQPCLTTLRRKVMPIRQRLKKALKEDGEFKYVSSCLVPLLAVVQQ
jgi:hypothetical protein